MIDIFKLLSEVVEENPEVKKMAEEHNRYKEERLKYHLEQGCSEEEAAQKMWVDFWKMAEEKDGVKFSIQKLK